MADTQTKKPSKAFIIGDKEHGLTIVMTNPVMVVHYSIEDLQNPAINGMAPNIDETTTMAAIVQELIPIFRGVNLDDIETKPGEFDETEVATELNYANAFARIVANGGGVHDVDFCIALELQDTSQIIKGRNVDPAKSIVDYLAKNSSTPQIYHIDGLETSNLGPLPPVQKKAP